MFGLLNATCFGLSYLMEEKTYKYYFAYKGNGRYFDAIRSMFGSNTLANAAWTIPSLLFCGQYMHNKVGALTMFKFTPLALLGILSFMTAFTPNGEYSSLPNPRPLARLFPKFDSMGKEYYMGADQLCQSIIYFTLLYHGMWTVSLVCAGFDVLYYGPMTLGGPLSAVVGALTLL